MKSHTEYLWFNTKERRTFVNITDDCEGILKKSGVSEGMMLVSAMHITAAVWVNDNESGILQDAMDLLERLAPYGPDYRHHRTREDNGDAHLKNLLTHHQVIIPITDGNMALGPWRTVFCAKFDGQRRKRVVVKVIGEGTGLPEPRALCTMCYVRDRQPVSSLNLWSCTSNGCRVLLESASGERRNHITSTRARLRSGWVIS